MTHLKSKTSLPKARSRIQAIFFRRGLNAIAQLGELKDSELEDAIAAPTDQSVIVKALQSGESLAKVREADPLLAARLRGVEAKQQLMQALGGTYSAEQVAHVLRLTRQAVDKRRKNRQLLALQLGRRGYFYPAWQFTGHGILPGLGDVLDVLKHHDPWMQLTFFVNPNSRLRGKLPVASLRAGEESKVLAAARAFGEHGAE